MFPICQVCGDDYLDPGCGGWTPDTPPHNCLESLRRIETNLITQAAYASQKLASLTAAMEQQGACACGNPRPGAMGPCVHCLTEAVRRSPKQHKIGDGWYR